MDFVVICRRKVLLYKAKRDERRENLSSQGLCVRFPYGYASLGEYVELYGYGKMTEVTIGGKTITVLPLAHPRQIGALGAHSEKWYLSHKSWEKSLKRERP